MRKPTTLSLQLAAIAFYFWIATAIFMGVDLAYARPIPEYVAFFGSIPNEIASIVIGVSSITGGILAICGYIANHDMMERLGLIAISMGFLFNSLGRFLWLIFYFLNPDTVPPPPDITELQPVTLVAYALLFMASGIGILFMSTRDRIILDKMGGKA